MSEVGRSRYQPIEELDFFTDLELVIDDVWKVVTRWQPFARDSVGLQLVRASDSVGANLVEGDARFSDKESLQYFRIARASAREARFWLKRATRRALIPERDAASLLQRLESVMRRVSALIRFRRAQVGVVKEQVVPY